MTFTSSPLQRRSKYTGKVADVALGKGEWGPRITGMNNLRVVKSLQGGEMDLQCRSILKQEAQC